MPDIATDKPVKKNGRPRNIDWSAIAQDPVKAFEKNKAQWHFLALRLAAQCEAYLKKGEVPPAQLTTQAAIAFDKAFSKADSTDTAVTVPRTLELAIIKALRVTGNKDYVNSGSGTVPAQAQDDSQVILKTETDQGPGPDPGVGLQPVPAAGAGAAHQTVSAAPEPDIFTENEKDLIPEQVTVPVPGPDQILVQANDRNSAYVKAKPSGHRRFVNPFLEQDKV